MKYVAKALFATMLLAGTAMTAKPADAGVAIGFSFGYGGGYVSNPCNYYDYYDAAPPWGLPPDYCGYPVYYDPIYVGGYWYRGPIYYRWYGGQRLYWVNGGWRRNEWRGAVPSIRWTDRGGWHGRGGWSDRGGWSGGHAGWSGDRGGWHGGDWGGHGGDRGGWSGGHSDHGGWSGGHGGDHGGSHGGGGHSGGVHGGGHGGR